MAIRYSRKDKDTYYIYNGAYGDALQAVVKKVKGGFVEKEDMNATPRTMRQIIEEMRADFERAEATRKVFRETEWDKQAADVFFD